ncbi:MAG TPA: TonB family protein [Longimicrobiaceae bacterium]
MFNVVTERRKRSVWTPRTVAISAGAHLLLLGAFVTAAESTPAPREERIIDLTVPTDPKPAAPQKVVTPPPPAPDRPVPVKGNFVSPRPPENVPTTVPPPDPNATPLHESEVSGEGVEGEVIGTPTPNQPPAAGEAENLPSFGEGDVIDADKADVLPRLNNERETQRILQRSYPPMLRDAGVTGRTTVVLIIDREGKVEPGSVRVQESTNPAFAEAAIRAAEKMRFTPAQFRGHPISVLIALPIDWQLQN